MSRNARRIAAFLDARLARRVVLAPLVVLIAIIALALTPMVLVGLTIADTVRGRKRLPSVRLLVLVVGALVLETIGIAASLVLWLLTGFGFAGSARWRWHMHRPLMAWYTSCLLRLISVVVAAPVEWRDYADLDRGNAVLIARHTSFFDAVIPAVVLARRNRLLPHHVVTFGLRYMPCIDIVGHRFPNRFIKRTPGEGSRELTQIEAVGRQLDDRSGAIIFPEGTFRNPHRFERAVRKLRRRQPELADRAAKLNHVLPPRANGTYALLQGAPTADIVVCTNTGLESFGSINDIVTQPYVDAPDGHPALVIETWRIPRADVPDSFEEFETWLFDQFVAIDAWVEQQRSKGC